MNLSSLFLLLSFSSQAQTNHPQPNILWIVCEDISPTLSFYGDSTALTPVLNQLATESLIYDNAFTTVGVCAPSRSSIITGMQATSIGTMHMRTGKDISSWGKRQYKSKIPIRDTNGDSIREYSAVIPAEVKCFSEYLRAAGYFCTNNSKTDYQFAAPLSAWDENNNKAHWRNRPTGKPFFSVFNINDTHESKLWKNEDLELTVDPKSVPVPPYLPDTEVTRKGIARHYSNVELMDAKVGKIIKQLKADSLYDQTIIFFYSDHGGPLPRQKRAVYDSGLKVPFLIKDIGAKPKGRTDRLISFVDLAPTMLSLAGIAAPTYMEGKAFKGVYESKPRQYVFGSSDRYDEVTDRIRVARNKRFLYVLNYFPSRPKYKDLAYRKKIPFMSDMLDAKEKGTLNEWQMQWFSTKTKEELYDCENDPHNMHNLANDKAYISTLRKFRVVVIKHQAKTRDWGDIPEAQMIDLMWTNGQQPTTATPIISQNESTIKLECPTPGASIVYCLTEVGDEKVAMNSKWNLYTGPFPAEAGRYLQVKAVRIGYQASETSAAKLN